MHPNVQSVVGAFLFFIGAVFFLGLAIRSWRLGRASLSWPSATGTVLRSEPKEFSNHEGSLGFIPEVVYEFEVDGRVIAGTRIRFGGYMLGNREPAQKVVNRYPVGAPVSVFYDPANPSRCTLDPSSSIAFVALWSVLSLMWIAVGVFWLLK